MRKPPQKLSRAEALQKIDSFIAELEANWEREGAPWGPELLALLQDFRRAAAGDAPDLQRLRESHTQLLEFLSRPKMKGFSPLQTYADSVVESYERSMV
jgi:hypothetical protein